MENTTQYNTTLAEWIIDIAFEYLEQDFTVKELAEMSEKEIVSKAKHYEYLIAEDMTKTEGGCYYIIKRLQIKDWSSWNDRLKFTITTIDILAKKAVLVFMEEYKIAEEIGRQFVHGTNEEVKGII